MQAISVQPYLLTEEEGEALWFFGSLITFKTPDDAGVVWMEQLMPPGAGSPYHIHTNEDELFYVIEGELSFISEGTVWKGGPGTFVFLPRGIPHGFRSETQSRSILMATNGDFGSFVREMGEPAQSRTIPAPGPIDMPKLLALAEKYNLKILGPLPDYTV